MAEPVRARRQLIKKGSGCSRSCGGVAGSVRVRRAMIIMASASGTLVPACPAGRRR